MWFRFYVDVLNDPKVQKLPAPLFKNWVNLLCIAKQYDGELPPIEDIAYALRISEVATGDIIQNLILRHLIDVTTLGKMTPHGWDKRQYKSDTSYDRVKKFRSKNRLRVVPNEPK